MTFGRKKAIDLFCGCGGISSGLRQSGFEVLAGLDIDKHLIRTFSHNFPSAQSITESITELKPEDLAKRVGLEPEELDILVGGPPCQGFSKNVPRRHRYLEDPKNMLVKSFLDYAEYFRPAIILMENVAEMKNGFEGQYTEEVIARLNEAGYEVTHAVLNAADYGVPQRRRRAFFMANRLGVEFRVPRPTHLPTREARPLLAEPSHVSVWQAISDLPSVSHGEGVEWTPYATDPASDFQRMMRSARGAVRNHVARYLEDTQFARLAALKPGEGNRDLPDHLRVKSGYSGAYGRLTKDMVAPTITRWVFHPGSGRWGHPVDTRVLTIREVARIQAFKDDYEFVGSYNQQAAQLGNAVPPLLAEAVISDLVAQIERHKSSSNSISRSREMRSAAVGN